MLRPFYSLAVKYPSAGSRVFRTSTLVDQYSVHFLSPRPGLSPLGCSVCLGACLYWEGASLVLVSIINVVPGKVFIALFLGHHPGK